MTGRRAHSRGARSRSPSRRTKSAPKAKPHVAKAPTTPSPSSWLQIVELALYVLVFSQTFSPSFLIPSVVLPLLTSGSWPLLLSSVSFYMFFERLILQHLLESPSILYLLPPRTHQLKSMYANGFTRLIIFWQIVSSLNRPPLESIYSIVTVSSFAALMSFHAVLLVDSKAHTRLAYHVGCPPIIFSIGNILVHGLPCLIGVMYPPEYLDFYSGLAASLSQILWGLSQTLGTDAGVFVLDEVYTKCPKRTWWALWIVAQVVNLSYPFWGVVAK
ncbi:hypothetical protein TrST_g10242 [Triparma strigata]|uniref:Uncharacterized protein n=1 Tax=Triparma strigata TaxID=1606541 RepID=A0A9W6ZQG7_9STRA|nr:hypothetical protein TrST_g10242 [Triparma strigata]